MSTHFNENNSKIGYADANMAFTMDTGLNFKESDKPGAKPAKDVQKNDEFQNADNVAWWGDDNLFPQNVQRAVAKSTIVLPTIEKQVAALYGGGLEYGVEVIEPGEETRFERIVDAEIEDFMECINAPIFFRDTMDHFYFLRNFFPEMILSKNRQKIVHVSALDASWSRWEKRKTGDLASKHLLYSAEWEDGLNGLNHDKIKVIDPGFYPIENLRGRRDAYKYVFPLSWTKRGRSYYSLASWDGMRTGGWLETLLEIPEFKLALMKNQTTVKYHIVVKDSYWEWKYPGFMSMKPEKRKKCMEDEAKYWKDTLSGSENAGKNIMTTDLWNEQKQQYDVGVTVTAIDNKIKDGLHIEDSQEAVAHIQIALGWDSAIIGRGPGKNAQSSGSGSDKAAALQNYLALTQPHRDLIMAPIHFIAKYNGWKDRLQEINPKGISKRLHFKFKPPFTATKVIDGKELTNNS
jgi:hypothetical protein